MINVLPIAEFPEGHLEFEYDVHGKNKLLVFNGIEFESVIR